MEQPIDQADGYEQIPSADGEDAKLGERLVANVIDQIFSHSSDAIMETLESSDDLAMAIGQMSAEVLKSQLDAMSAVGKKLSQDVYLDAGATIVQNLTEMAHAMGLVDAENQQEIQQLQTEAMMNATQIFAQIAPDQVDAGNVERLAVDAVSGKYDHLGGANDTQANPAMNTPPR